MAELIEFDIQGYGDDVQLAVNPAGDAVVAWKMSDGTRYNIWSAVYR